MENIALHLNFIVKIPTADGQCFDAKDLVGRKCKSFDSFGNFLLCFSDLLTWWQKLNAGY